VFGQKKAKKGAKDDSNPATADDYKKIRNTKNLTGTLRSIEPSSKTLTIRVEYSHYEPNPKYKPAPPPKGATGAAAALARLQAQMYQTSLDLQRQQQLMANARTPQEQQRAMNKYQQDLVKYQSQQSQYMTKMLMFPMGTVNTNPNNQPFITVTDYKDYSLEYKDEVVVRKMFLPQEFDDTGNIKEYTKDEKEALRGKDKTKPGYEAKIEELLSGQEVKLTLTPPPPPKKKDTKVAKDSKDAPEEDPEMVPDRPTANTIVMTKDMGASGSTSDPAPKKGKKNQ